MTKKTNTETISVRLDPKLKYFCDLVARHERRTLSSFVESAISKALDEYREEGKGFVLNDNLWDVDASDRFAKLAVLAPQLMTFEEQKDWGILNEADFLWDTNMPPEAAIKLKILRENLDFINENVKSPAAKERIEEIKGLFVED